MSRRKFLGAIAIGAVTAPVRKLGAQTKTMPTIGFLATAPQPLRQAAFWRGLSENGFSEGANVRIEYRFTEGRFERLPELALELVRQRVDVITTPGNTAAALAAKAATSTIPIVFGVSEDPVKVGLVASLGRPGGNATGINYFATEIVAKRLEVMRELLPRAVRVAALINPPNVPNASTTLRELDAAARTLRLEIARYNASTAAEIDSAFMALMRKRPDALFVAPDSYYNIRRKQLTQLAAAHGIPAVYSVRDYVEDGGLVSYGPSITDMNYRVGVYTGKVLGGRRPTELPVEQVSKLELVINTTTAKALGLTIPSSILLRADDVVT